MKAVRINEFGGPDVLHMAGGSPAGSVPFAVQLAQAQCAEMVTTMSPKDMALVRVLGITHLDRLPGATLRGGEPGDRSDRPRDAARSL